MAETLRLLGQTVRRLPQVMKQAGARLGDGPPPEVASLGERLDALGREVEALGFAARVTMDGHRHG